MAMDLYDMACHKLARLTLREAEEPMEVDQNDMLKVNAGIDKEIITNANLHISVASGATREVRCDFSCTVTSTESTPPGQLKHWAQEDELASKPVLLAFCGRNPPLVPFCVRKNIIPWICYERNFSEFYLSIWNQLVFNQRLQLFVQSPQPYLLIFAWRN